MPAKCRESLCSFKVLPLGNDVYHHLERRYPLLFAPTDSCANPSSSPPLRFRYSRESLQVVVSPCWIMDLPDIISVIFRELLGPLPRCNSSVLLPVSSGRTAASQYALLARLTKYSLQCNFNRGGFSGLQSFAHVQASLFARPTDCTYLSLYLGSWALYPTHTLTRYLLSV
jgi:hypothetical protein